jgi:hypothetical protein
MNNSAGAAQIGSVNPTVQRLADIDGCVDDADLAQDFAGRREDRPA